MQCGSVPSIPVAVLGSMEKKNKMPIESWNSSQLSTLADKCHKTVTDAAIFYSIFNNFLAMVLKISAHCANL